MAEKHALIPEVPTHIQTDMKESQDISKNLMSGDFERQFRGSMVDEKTTRRWQSWLITLGVVVAALVLWLLVFTVVREVQVRQLRHEVDELSAIVIALSANVKSLSHLSSSQMDKNKQLPDFKDVQDTIYADEDLSIDGKSVVKDRAYDSLEKLQGLTVLEDESQGDDEDALDSSDDAESGDWYPDYDKRAEHIGTSDMVHLQPEDFMDTDLGFNTDGDKDMQSNIREIKRRLNENPEDPDIALSIKNDIKNADRIKQIIVPVEKLREKRSVFPDSAADAVDEFAAPRMMAKTDERHKTKKYSSNAELSPAKMALHTVTRTVRNSDNSEVRRPFIAAHFHGNTSHLNQEIHEHYKGNGLVRVNHGAHHDVWSAAPWTQMAPRGHPTLDNGHVRVHHTGVYLVYVQIYYLDDHDVISWVLHRTGRGIEGRERVMQCAQSTHSNGSEKANSCFSAAAVFLREDDKLTVRNTGGDRHSLMQPEKSFIGLIKLADGGDPNQEL